MNFLKFYEGAVPGKKRKPDTTENQTAEKKLSAWRNYETHRVVRKFNIKWKDGREWLDNNEDKGMTCSWCIEHFGKEPTKSPNLKGQNAFLTGCKNLRISTVIEHEKAKCHLRAIEIKNAKNSSVEEVKMSESGKALMSLKAADRHRLCNLFRNAHAVAKKNRPISDYTWLNDVDRSKGLEVGNTYLNAKAAINFINSIAEVETKKTVKIINSANFFSFIMDGSTDISGDEQESIYVRCASRGKVTERFLHIGSPPSTCSQDLFNYLMMIFDSHGINKGLL
jgi:hypothetical protein